MDGHFTGYASVFGVPDLGRDVVVPGAFAGSLARRGAAGVRMLFQHDPAEPIGRWLSLREDARGLLAEGQLNLAVQRAREVDALMRGCHVQVQMAQGGTAGFTGIGRDPADFAPLPQGFGGKGRSGPADRPRRFGWHVVVVARTLSHR